MKVYRNFDEVEKEMTEVMPPVIYKYRNWEENWHKKIITDSEVWFAHPHSLNDPYDVRPPYNFLVDDLDFEILENKMRGLRKTVYPPLTDEQFEMEVNKRLQLIKQDPIQYFTKNRIDFVSNNSNYDEFGVLSLCASIDNEPMWSHYGNNHCGFAIGFNTVVLIKALDCMVGFVDYCDAPIDYDVMRNNEESFRYEIYRKSTKWKSEEEVRFITASIGINRTRQSNFPIESVKEIVFGLSTKKEVQEEIINMAQHTLPQIPFYQITVKSDKYGFDKRIIE